MDHLNEMRLKLLLKKEKEEDQHVSTEIGLKLLTFLEKLKPKLSDEDRLSLKKFLAETSLFL